MVGNRLMEGTKISDLQKSFGIIGESDDIKEIIETIAQVAKADITVLIIGESGTGKELVADAIYKSSLRRHRPFIKVNCGAIPAGIIESELFGHVKGSFTGAIEDRKGYFETADGGTIFLDEIGEMPLETQVKLLRILELGEFIPVGGSKAKRVDVRIIAATNKDLYEEVEKGNFRRDLFYRIKTVTIAIPPLRKHPEDIPLLVEKFALDFANRNNIPFKGFSPSAMKLLQQYPWPGNVRELKNFVESMIVLHKGEVITSRDVTKRLFAERKALNDNLPIRVGKPPDQAERELILHQLFLLREEIRDLKSYLFSGGREQEIKSLPPLEAKKEVFVEDEILTEEEPAKEEEHTINPAKIGKVSLEDVERELIEETLRKFNFQKRKTANVLKISERTLYRKIKEYGLEDTEEEK
ncbi:MAG: sigma-54-dependent Fis family transcriptional regulator [Candidatus Neomarinimicrobiota bacterium]|nr:sigma-54-dependent Fis family transcriptional regulator [Candidatus Neomarinimicrobiota bacterium]RKY48060.1 MAG: sigma-54-dependent Fis family transcriptional regulator [Candidatus Neomarinimicrobiota bacterium]HDN60027.1 sigma-54-dependent Fis family transcriptional regulator [Candidatus Neomarinimicrobiota bacterium]